MKNVLSLFDGISCGYQALKDSNVSFKGYYASEIDKNAIKISKHNHPDIKHVGDVRTLTSESLPQIDMIIGGSPCTDFTFTGKRRGMTTTTGEQILDLETYLALKSDGFEFVGQSYLFWEYVRLVKELNPKYFLLENVKMSQKWEDVITNTLGVAPLKINSSRLVPQNRERIYWTNIPQASIPEDRSPQLSDIIFGAVSGVGFRGVPIGHKPDGSVLYDVTKSVRKDNIANAIITSLGGYSEKSGKWNGTGHYVTVDSVIKTFSVAEAELLQGLPNGYVSQVPEVSNNKKIHGIGNGWTVPVISHLLKGLATNKGSKKNPTWDERTQFENDREGKKGEPHYHFPKGW